MKRGASRPASMQALWVAHGLPTPQDHLYACVKESERSGRDACGEGGSRLGTRGSGAQQPVLRGPARAPNGNPGAAV